MAAPINNTYVQTKSVVNTPGGSNTSIQYNLNGTFAGDTGLKYNPVAKEVTVQGNIKVGGWMKGKIFTNPYNFFLTGGNANQILSTDGTGNLSWVNQSGGSGGSSTYGDSNVASYLLTNTGNISAGNIKTNNLLYANGVAWNFGSTYANSNVSAYLPTYTGNVSANNFIGNISHANVVGLGNIATINLTGSSSTVLYGNGVFGSIPTVATPTLQQVTSQGSTTANAIHITNTTLSDSYNAGALKVAGGLGIVGNIHVGGHIATESTVYSGHLADFSTWTNPKFIGRDAGSQYIQGALINTSNTGSADWVTYGDQSDESNGWTDMGFSGTQFNDPTYTITKASDGYFFVQGMPNQGGNLVIATGGLGDSTHRDIVFATGGFLSTNEKFRYQHSTNALVPFANVTMDLGASDKRFKDIYSANVSIGGTLTFADGTTQTTATIQGSAGADGASAYDVAVTNGFVGNETAWLASLAGASGTAGADGADGAAATITVGTVTTGLAGSSVSVTNVGNSHAAIFDFAIPRGSQGATGAAGRDGIDGLNGQNGLNGTNGTNGTNGRDGVDGVNGAKGDTGAQGVSVTLQGTKATIADLPLTGNAGDGWIVTTGDGGTHLDGSLWFWNVTDGAWNDIGPIVGPKGDQGEPGINGTNGIDGVNGIDGQNGLNGQDGAAGADGANGTGFTWWGAWDSEGSYASGIDVVSYNGSTYIKINGNGNTGSTPDVDTANWQVYTSKGTDGTNGTNGIDALWNFRGAYDNVASYAIGDVATYGGETWYRIDANFSEGGDIPVEGTFWTKIAQKGTDGAPGSSITGWTVDASNHLIPDTDILQDIGTPTNRVRHLYVGPGSITIGDSVLSESTTGKLVVPGLTRATSLFADEVEDVADQTRTWSGAPFLLDAYMYEVTLGNFTPDPTWVPADYSITGIDGEGYIDGIDVDPVTNGVWTQTVADYNRNNNMYAFIGTDVAERPFNPAHWVQIPFRVRAKANDVEYEFNQGGGGITVSEIDAQDEAQNEVSNVTAIRFDSTTGFSVTELGDGEVKVSLGSSWKTWQVDGQEDLVAVGEDTVTFVAGTNIDIATDATAKTITFSATGSGGPVDLSDYQAGSDPIRLETNQSLVMLVDGQTGIDAGGSSMRLYANNHYIVLTDEGRLDLDAGIKFQDGTTQTTAYTGGTNANTGNVVFDGNQMYVGGTGFLNLDSNDRAVIGTNGTYPLIVSLNEDDKQWEFNPDGDLHMPDGGAIRFNYGYIDQDPNTDTDALRISGGNGVTIKADEDGKTWRFNNDGTITFPDATVQTTAYTGGEAGSSTVVRQDTAPTSANGTLWFNTVEGRLYLKYNDAWVDAAPLIQPLPATDIEVETITFADSTVQTSAYSNKLVNGTNEVVLNASGDLIGSNDIIATAGGRFIKDCGDDGAVTSMRWINVPTNVESELIRAYTGDPKTGEDSELVKISLKWQNGTDTGLAITSFNDNGSNSWEFRGDGKLEFPDGTKQTTAYVSGQKTFLVDSTTAAQDNYITETASVYFITPATDYVDSVDQLIVLPMDAPLGTKITIINNYGGNLNVVVDRVDGFTNVTIAAFENRDYVLINEPGYGTYWWETNSYSW